MIEGSLPPQELKMMIDAQHKRSILFIDVMILSAIFNVNLGLLRKKIWINDDIILQ